MNFFKVVKGDLRAMVKSRLFRISLIGIIIVPVLYSLLYLKAFWDPYGSLDNLPIAVVNLDEGSTVDGEKVNYGDDVIDSLKDNDSVKWSFVSKDEAYDGLKGDKYYAIFQIDKDFSEQMLSAKSGTGKKATMEYICNEKKNYLAAQISSKIESSLKEQVQSSITKSYVEGAFDNLYEVKDGMVDAADGSSQLTDGLQTVNDSVPELADGVNKLGSGSNELYAGQNSLNQGIFALNSGLKEASTKASALSGVSELSAGASQINSGLNTAYSSSNVLANGINSLYSNYTNKIYPAINQLASGSSQLDNALKSNAASLTQLSQGATAIKNSSQAVNAGVDTISAGYSQVKAGTEKLISSAGQTSDVMNKLAATLSSSNLSDSDKINSALAILSQYSQATSGSAEQLQELQQGLDSLNTGLNTYSTSVKQYTAGASAVADGANQLVTSVGDASNAVDQINTGLNSLNTALTTKDANNKNYGDYFKDLNNGQGALTGGLSTLYNGSTALQNGIDTANAKIPTLLSGLNQLYDGSSSALTGSNKLLAGQKELNDGIQTLSSKVPTLTDGVKKLYDGSTELTSALTDGSAKLQDGLVNSSKDMADFVSDAVDLQVNPINEVGGYGAGFAPYFMNLSLWVGAIMMYFVISLGNNDEDKNVSKFSKVFGKFVTSSIVGVAQAILVGLAIMAIGLRPEHLLAYFGSLIFLSLVYISIVQLCITLFGDAGRLLAIVLLVLQLASCGGTFPIELVPKIFQTLNPFMPFTYGVSIIREVIAAVNISGSLMAKDFAILTAVLVVAIAVTTLLKGCGERFNNAFDSGKQKYLAISKTYKNKGKNQNKVA